MSNIRGNYITVKINDDDKDDFDNEKIKNRDDNRYRQEVLSNIRYGRVTDSSNRNTSSGTTTTASSPVSNSAYNSMSYEEKKDYLKDEKGDALKEKLSAGVSKITSFFSSDDTKKELANSRYEQASTEYDKYKDALELLRENKWTSTQEENAKLIASNSELQKLVEQARNAKINLDAAQSNSNYYSNFGDPNSVANNLAVEQQQKEYQSAYKQYSDITNQIKELGYDAESLIDTYTRQKNLEETEQIVEDVSEFADNNPVMANIASVGLNSMQALTAPETVSNMVKNTIYQLQTGDYRPADANSFEFIPTRAMNAIRETTSKNIQEDYDSEFVKSTANLLYQTGMSMADSLSTMPLTVVPGARSAVIGASAMTQGVVDATDRGVSSGNALLTGLAQGVAEVVGEAVGLGNLKVLKASGKTGVKNFVKDVLKQSFVEGSEETFTEISNIITDKIINDDKSSIDQTYNSYIEAGYSEDEARKQTAKDTALQVLQAFAGGAVSGGVFGAGASTINSVNINNAYKAQGNAIKSADQVSQLVNKGLEQDTSSPAYKVAMQMLTKDEVADTYITPTNENVSSKKLGQLNQEVVKKNDISVFSTLVKGEKDAQTLTESFTKLINGENLSRKQINTLMTNETSRKALSQLTNIDAISTKKMSNSKLAENLAADYRNTSMLKLDYLQRPTEYAITKSGETVILDGIEENKKGNITVKTLDNQVLNLDEINVQNDDTKQLLDYSKTLDDKTSKAFVEGYNYHKYNGTVNDYFAGTKEIIKAQVQGKSFEEAYSTANKVSSITKEQAEHIYFNSVLDQAVNNTVREKNKANIINQKKKVVFDNAISSKVKPGATVLTQNLNDFNKSEIKTIELIAKKYGREVIIVDDTEELGYASSNGFYENGKIVLAANNETGIMSAYFGHELFHDIKKNSPKQAQELQDFVISTLKEQTSYNYEQRFESLKELYKDEIDGLSDKETTDFINEEITANACFTVFTNEDNVNRLVKENKTLAEKIRDFFINFRKTIENALVKLSKSNKEYDALQGLDETVDKIAQMFDAALNEEQKNHTTKNDSVKFSINEKFALDYDNWDKKNPAFHFVIGNTSKALKSIGIENMSIVWDSSKIIKIKSKHQEMTDNIIKQVPNILEDPIVIMQSINSDSRITLFGEVYTNGNKPVLAVLELKPFRKNILLNEIKLVSAYEKNKAQNFINRSKIIYVDSNKKRVNEWSRFTRLQLPVNRDITNSNNKVPQNDTSVNSNNMQHEHKYSMKQDSEGNELSAQQQEYFKDSKVRDEDGNLLVVYHGTPNATFSEFRSGSYFTPNKIYADRYQYPGASSLSVKINSENPDTYKVYLNITKPFDTRNENEREIFNNEFYMKWGNGSPLSEKGLPDWVEAMDLQEFIEENGYDYDGLIVDEGADGGYGLDVIDRGIAYVTFNAEQVKNIDNKNPTDDPDIRFSLKESVEETRDLIAVHNISESNLLKSLELGGFPMPSIAIMKAQQADANADYGNTSVVFYRDTVDPQLNSLNKVYGGDAWTPRFPSIEYEINYDKASNIYHTASSLNKNRAAFNNTAFLHPDNIEDSINRFGTEKYIENLKNDYTLKQLYLLENGEQPVEMQQRENRTEVSEAEAELYDYLNKEIPNYHIVPPSKWNETYGAAFDKAYSDYYRNNFNFTEDGIENVLNNMNAFQKKSIMSAAQRYAENGRVTVTVTDDVSATEELIDSKIDTAEFEQWVENMFSNIVLKQGIRNNADPYTSLGNERSFDELHYEVTLENLVRQMKTQKNGEGAFFSGLGIWGVAAKNYGTIDELKSDSFRLQKLTDEEYSRIKTDFGERFTEISHSLENKYKADNPYIDEDNKMTNILDALRSSKTKSGVLNYLNRYFNNANESTVEDLLNLVADIGNMPTQYFEAKPQRAVKFNEIAKVILPDNASTELKSILEDNKVEYLEYPAGDENARIEAINSLDEAKFSKKESNTNYEDLLRENEELSELNENLQRMLELVSSENNELREQFKIKTVRTQKESSVNKVSAYLRKQYESNYDKSTLTSRLAGLYDYITNVGEDIDSDYIWNVSKDIATDLLSDTQIKDTTVYDENKELRDYIRKTTIQVPENVRNDMAEYNDFRKRNFGTMRLSNDKGTPLDTIYSELSNINPAYFPADAVLSEQLEHIENFFNSTEIVYYNGAEMIAEENGLSLDEYSNIVASDIFDQYFNVPEVQSFVSEKNQEEMELLHQEYKAQLEDVRKLYRERYEEQLRSLREENQQRLEKLKDKNDKTIAKLNERHLDQIAKQKAHFKDVSKRGTQRRNASKLRESIRRSLKKIAKLGASPDKKNHIPNSIIDSVKSLADTINLDNTKKDELISTKLNQIKTSFDTAKKNNEYKEMSEAYNDFIENEIIELQARTEGKTLKQLTNEDLESIDKILKATVKAISNINKLFKKDRTDTVNDYAASIKLELSNFSKDKITDGTLRNFAYNSMKPEYFFEYLGSDTFLELYNDLRKGEDVWVTDVNEAKRKADGLRNKYGWNTWDDETITFSTISGDVELNLQERLAIYANSLGEHTKNHLLGGGFKYQPKKSQGFENLKKQKNDNQAHRLSEEDIIAIVSTLTNEQTSYVKDMIDYMSTVMARKGNEVSKELYDVELFKEATYYPAKVDRESIIVSSKEVRPEKQIKNAGFTNATVINAKQPVILIDFDTVWATHIDEMSKYHAFVLPLDNFDRVFNSYQVVDNEYRSVKENIKNSFGSKAVNYIDDFIRDINGGVVQEPGADIMSKLTGLFKKNAVFASMSVVVQQPSAIARALAEIDVKYLAKATGKGFDRNLYNEMKHYAPIAQIKEMGYFDTNMAQSTVDYLNKKSYEGLQNKVKAFVKDGTYRDDALSFFASKGDEITWTQLWQAVKYEIADKNAKSNKEDQLKLAGERFTDIISKTQVYDSVFSRSGLMRSRDTAVKNAMAFMAEPTTSLNMLTNAIIQTKRGKMSKVQGAKVLGSLVAASIMNSLLQSIVTSARDVEPEEDDEWLNIYLAHLVPNFINNINPLNQIAFVKDIVNIFKGYDVSRADMNLFSDFADAVKKLDSDNATVTEKITGLSGAISAFFGFPLKNIIRDLKAAFNTGQSIFNGFEVNSTESYEIYEEEMNQVFGFELFKPEYDKAVKAIKKGDYEGYEKYAETVYASSQAYNLLYEVLKKYGYNSSEYKRAEELCIDVKKDNGTENPNPLSSIKNKCIKEYSELKQNGTYSQAEEARQRCIQVYGSADDVVKALEKYEKSNTD